MAHMNLIAIETSTEACSAALLVNGQVIESYRFAPREHTELILPMVDGLMAEAGLARSQLDGVAFGRGPGAFTGVRIGASVAQGIAFALDLPVVPVSTLAALAHGVWRDKGHNNVIAAIDARMSEVYCGHYSISTEGEALAMTAEQVAVPAMLNCVKGSWFGAGSGWQSYHEQLLNHFGERISGYDAERFPRAYDVVLIGARLMSRGESVSADQALPVYLRDQVVQRAVSR